MYYVVFNQISEEAKRSEGPKVEGNAYAEKV